MENKKYLDKVIGFLVSGTNMDYENEKLHTPFDYGPIYFHVSRRDSIFRFLQVGFKKYSINEFGLTDDEIKYVWDKYTTIILDKIENGK